MKTYEVSSAYKLCAISKAAGILNRYRKLSREHHVNVPYCSRKSLTTCYGIRVIDGKLLMRGGFEIPLNAHVRHFLSQADLEIRSVTLTPDSLSISVRKQIEPVGVVGMLGVDSNLDNVTIANTAGQSHRFDLSQIRAARIK